MDLIQVEDTLNKMIEEIRQAREKLAAGADFGLEDISERIAAVCAAATALPEEEVLQIQPLLQTLRDDLTSFSTDMESIRERAENEANIIDVPES